MRLRVLWLILLGSSGLFFPSCNRLKNLDPLPVSEKLIESTSEEKPLEKRNETTKSSSLKKLAAEGLETKTRDNREKNKIAEPSSILRYFRFLDSLSENGLKREHALAQKEFSENRGLINHLRLAMLLSVTNPNHQDHKSSLSLFNEYLDDMNVTAPVLRDFLFLFSTFVRKLTDQDQHLKNQDRRYKKLSQKLKGEQDKNHKLEKMIEALKTIEKSLMKRD